ncbi:hypothetical protein ACFE04_023604 [Oxalis oulophora]
MGTLLGPLSDILGHKRICLLFCILQLVASIWKKISPHPSIWVGNICLSLASSMFYFCFETWAVVEHEKLEHGQDALSDTFWLMTFFESASLVGSQVLSISSTTILFLAIVGMVCVTRKWTECYQTAVLKDYRMSFYTYIVKVMSWNNKNTQLARPLQTNNGFGMGTSLSSFLNGSLLATMGTNTSGMVLNFQLMCEKYFWDYYERVLWADGHQH